MELKTLLVTQGFTAQQADKLATQDSITVDPITQVVINAYNNNNCCDTQEDRDNAMQDLQYAIEELQAAKTAIEAESF